MSTIIRNSFLAGVLAQPRAGRINQDTDYRRYRANVRSSAPIGGVTDTRVSQISYEVGRAVNTKGRALSRTNETAVLVEAGYHTAGALAEDFVGLAKKYTNFSADFAYSSLAGIVERLARGLAAASLFDGVNSTDLRAGRVLVVNALGTYDGPVNSLASTVFVPRLVNSVMTGDVFSVLANAIAGEGSSVATDIIELDAVTRQPIIPYVDGDGLPRALVDALRLLGGNMIASDQGPLFALALTRGLHRVLSVVGHTDEGAVTRDLLRCSGFAPPFGGIHYGLEPYTGLPALASNNAFDVASYVDALALSSAALVAHCDPGEQYDGRWLPTFYLGTSADEVTSRPGEDVAGTAAMAGRNRAQLLANLPKFSDVYVAGLGKLFCAEGDSSVASAFMRSASSLLTQDPRHLRYPSVAPWFWVEPTSLIPHDFLGSRSELEGFASLGGRDSTRTRSGWEDIVAAGPCDTAFSAYHVVMRSARTSWFLHHWAGHPLNGLGAVSVRQLDPNAIVHPGPNAAHPEVRDRVEAGDPIASYLWTRGQSPFCAPSELINLSGTMGIHVRHLTFDDEGIPTLEHLPNSSEFLNTAVTITVGRPIGLSVGGSNFLPSDARRAKTRAARELAAASARVRAFGRPDVSEMATLTSAPVMRGAPNTPAPPTRDQSQGGATAWMRGAVGAGDGSTDAVRQATGAPRPPVPMHDGLKYPPVPRPAGNQPGGAGNPVPPPPPPPVHGDDSGDDAGGPELPVAPAGGAPPNGPAPQ